MNALCGYVVMAMVFRLRAQEGHACVHQFTVGDGYEEVVFRGQDVVSWRGFVWLIRIDQGGGDKRRHSRIILDEWNSFVG